MKKQIHIFIAFLLLLATDVCTAQSQFQRAIGGPNYDYAYSITQTTDSGFAVTGSTIRFGTTYDVYIVKIDATGTLQWTRTYGGLSNNEYAYSIIQTTDGGFAVAGEASSFGAGGTDFYIVKLNGGGTLQWTRTVGGNGYDYARGIVQTLDGGYAVTGYTGSFGAGVYDFCIVKLDTSGTLQWSKTVGGTSTDFSYSIQQTTDGGYVLAGSTLSFGEGSYDIYVVKISGTGALQWNKAVGGPNTEYAYSIIQAADGGYAIVGTTAPFGGGNADMYIVKLDTAGTLSWSRTVGGTGDDQAYSIVETTDGGYIVAGYTTSFGGGGRNFYIVKLNGGGTLQWTRTVGGTGTDQAYSIVQTMDGGYAVTGHTFSFGAGQSDVYITKFDANWNTCGNTTNPTSQSGTTGTITSPTPSLASPTPTVTTPSATISTGGTVTTICLVGIQLMSNELPHTYELFQNYPNPFNPSTNISFDLPKSSFTKVVIYDLIGREVAILVNEELKTGVYSVYWNASTYPSGIYYYRLVANDFTYTKKMVLLK